MTLLQSMESIENGVTELDEAIDAVVGEMLEDERLYVGKAYLPVGGERGLVELAGQVLTPLRKSLPAIVKVVRAAQAVVDHHDYKKEVGVGLCSVIGALRAALAEMEGR